MSGAPERRLRALPWMALCLQNKSLTCTATLSDGTDSVSEAALITLENRSPTGEAAVSYSGTYFLQGVEVAAQYSQISCELQGEFSDPDGDDLSESIRWYLDEELLSDSGVSITVDGVYEAGSESIL